MLGGTHDSSDVDPVDEVNLPAAHEVQFFSEIIPIPVW
jgi:hypothetical protein